MNHSRVLQSFHLLLAEEQGERVAAHHQTGNARNSQAKFAFWCHVKRVAFCGSAVNQTCPCLWALLSVGDQGFSPPCPLGLKGAHPTPTSNELVRTQPEMLSFCWHLSPFLLLSAIITRVKECILSSVVPGQLVCFVKTNLEHPHFDPFSPGSFLLLVLDSSTWDINDVLLLSRAIPL